MKSKDQTAEIHPGLGAIVEEAKPTTTAKLPQQPEAKQEPRKDRGPLRNQFACAIAEHVLRTMDVTYIDGHHSLDKFAEKVFLLADVLVKESNK